VDLYQSSGRTARREPSYSIKSIEHLYRGKRGGDVATAGESMVYYANWMESASPGKWEGSPILRKIRDYNRDDCESTVQLYDWLCEHQKKAGIAYVPPVRPEVKEAAAEALAAMKERRTLSLRLRARLPGRRTRAVRLQPSSCRYWIPPPRGQAFMVAGLLAHDH